MGEQERRPRVIVQNTPEEADQFAAELVKTIICEASGRRGVCVLAMAGGTTPRGLYEIMAGEATSGDVPWGCVQVFFSDERDVPHDNVDSNYHMVQRTLLDHVPVSIQNIHPMPADAPDIYKAAEQYEQTVRRVLPAGHDGIPRFDLTLLGMGGDGHVASLFPQTPALAEEQRLVVAQAVPVLGRNRMTFTFPLINASRNVLMLVTGEDKAEVVGRLIRERESDRTQLPAAGVKPADGRLFVVLDAVAARGAGLRPD